MYLPESDPAIAELAGRLAPGGWLSVLTRNARAVAWRPAIRHDWEGASAALDELAAADAEGRDPRYTNEIGAAARADRIEHLLTTYDTNGLVDVRWHGVRVASDDVDLDTPVPEPDELAALLDVEERLGARDPYRQVATLAHVLGQRGR